MFCLPFWRFQRERISTTSVLPPLPCRRQFPWRFQRFRGGRGAGSSMVKSYRRGGYPGGSGDFEGFRSWEFQEPRTWSKTHLKRSDKCPLRMVGRAPYWNSQGPTRGSSRGGAPGVSPSASLPLPESPPVAAAPVRAAPGRVAPSDPAALAAQRARVLGEWHGFGLSRGEILPGA